MENELPEIFRQMSVKECLDLADEMRAAYPAAKIAVHAPAFIWFSLIVRYGANVATTIRSRAEWDVFAEQLREALQSKGEADGNGN